MEFWNSDLTDASWQKLVELKKEIDFVLIGGWAVYLYDNLHKSKDIDIVVSYDTLGILKRRYTISKNERLFKYEIKLDRFDIDIYLPNYSRLTIVPEEILEKYAKELKGFRVPIPEVLLVLKLGALADRQESLKGEKDKLDVLGILFYSGVDLGLFAKILREHKIERHLRLLQSTLKAFDSSMLKYLNLNEKSFSKLKTDWLEQMAPLIR